MSRFLRDSGHLVRPALVLLAGLGLFLLVRSAVIPKAFGQYGHYRPAALDLNRQKPLVFAGQGRASSATRTKPRFAPPASTLTFPAKPAMARKPRMRPTL